MSDTCRSCSAPLIWATSPKGRPLPLDARAVVYVIDPNETKPQAEKANDESGTAAYYVSHFATCPNASSHSRRKKK